MDSSIHLMQGPAIRIQMAMNYEAISRMHVEVELVIFGYLDNSLKVILKKPPKIDEGPWALPSRKVRCHENMDSVAEYLLLEVCGHGSNVLAQFKTFYNKEKGSLAGPSISVGWYSLVSPAPQLGNLRRKSSYAWWPIYRLDHLDSKLQFILSSALVKFRNTTRFYPIILELLPEKFTIYMLRRLYEILNEQAIDRSNFHKKILATGMLIKLTEKDKTRSKKGSFLYTVNKPKYLEMLQSDL